VLAETLGGRHAFAESPFDDLGEGVSWYVGGGVEIRGAREGTYVHGCCLVV
jgi:hypothetical protein